MRALLHHRLRTAGDPPGSRDAGAATMFVIGLSTMLLVLAGLVVDGGLAINARAEAADVAEQAARAGAQEIDEGVLRDTGQIELGEGAVGRAQDFLLASGFVADGGEVGAITVVGDEITVGVTAAVRHDAAQPDRLQHLHHRGRGDGAPGRRHRRRAVSSEEQGMGERSELIGARRGAQADDGRQRGAGMSTTRKPAGRPQTGAARFQQVAPPPKKSAGESFLAALALAALVLGVPALLLVFNGPPPIPTSLDLDALTGTISTEQVIDVLVGVVWLAWLHFALCTLVEVVAAVRGGTLAPHVPLGGGSQRLARALVAAMLLSTGIATQASAMVAPPSAGVVASQSVQQARQHRPAPAWPTRRRRTSPPPGRTPRTARSRAARSTPSSRRRGTTTTRCGTSPRSTSATAAGTRRSSSSTRVASSPTAARWSWPG